MTSTTRDQVKLLFIRSGKTQSGREARFLGTKDEGLLKNEQARLQSLADGGYYGKADRVYTCNRKRCIETAQIIYPQIKSSVAEGLGPYDYGTFEGKTYREITLESEELKSNAYELSREYREIPEGEPSYAFIARITDGFRKLLEEIEASGISTAAVILPYNVIQTILRRFTIPRSIPPIVQLEFGEGIYFTYDYESIGGRISGKPSPPH